MSVKPIDLTGGKSVFCFNEAQFTKATELARSEGETGDRIRALIDLLEKDYTRNERAALAFVVIDKLNRTSPAEG